MPPSFAKSPGGEGSTQWRPGISLTMFHSGYGINITCPAPAGRDESHRLPSTAADLEQRDRGQKVGVVRPTDKEK